MREIAKKISIDQLNKIVEQSQQIAELEQKIQGGSGNGWSETAVSLFSALLKKIYYSDDSAKVIGDALIAELNKKEDTPTPPNPEEPDEPQAPTLLSITVEYNGDMVAVGTDVNDLDITVKAIYSDGSIESVVEYEVSGVINEGTNTITVSYQGKTATFEVVGKIAEYYVKIPKGYGGILEVSESGFTSYKSEYDVEIGPEINATNVLAGSGGASWVGFKSSDWGNCNSETPLSEVLNHGRVKFTLTHERYASHRCIGYPPTWAQYCPDLKIYGVKFYGTSNNLLHDLVPTENNGEMKDMVTGNILSFSITDGITNVSF